MTERKPPAANGPGTWSYVVRGAPSMIKGDLVLVTGTRSWRDERKIRRTLAVFPRAVTVAHGAAAGADSLAGKVAKDLGFTVREFPAQWNSHGIAAGYIRNQQMVDLHPSIVIGFWNGRSAGTADCLCRAIKARIPTFVVYNVNLDPVRVRWIEDLKRFQAK
jgi:hypothetical protein